MADQLGQLKSLYERQKQEMDRHVASYLEVENKVIDHAIRWNECTDAQIKLDFARTKDQLTKARDALLEDIESAKTRMATTEYLLRIKGLDTERVTGNPRSLPTLPTFRPA